MNLVKNFLPTIGLVVGLLGGAEAQESERLYPFVELTDADLAQIDVTDGSIDEWVDLLGEPTLIPLDFQIHPDDPPYDPVDMDYRVWLAWHGATQRLYVAVERADDIYINNYEDDGTIRSCIWMARHDSYVMFGVDGDASGGQYDHFSEGSINTGPGFDEELRLRIYQHAQDYYVLGDIVGGGPHVCLPAQSAYNDEDWFQRPPYAEGGGASFGEQPTLSVTEFYVTPFDRLIWNSPEESVVSALSPGTLIGFYLGIADYDEEGARAEGWHFIRGRDYSSGSSNADSFARGLLVGPGGELPDSAVESMTWGRIKATFVR